MTAWEAGWQLDVIRWFQVWRVPAVQAVALFFHVIGSAPFYIGALPFVYWCVDAVFGRRLGAILMFNFWLNGALKSWWRRPRPFSLSTDITPPVLESSYGAPSGHTQGSAFIGAFVAHTLRRRWVTVLMVAYILLMGLSRMMLGVHYPQDVISGLIVGLLLVAAYAHFEPRIGPWFESQSSLVRIGLIVAAGVVMTALHPGLIHVSSPEWLATPVDPEHLFDGPAAPIAAFLGLGIGFVLEREHVRFSARGPALQRVLRFVVGVAGVLALYFGIDTLSSGLHPILVFRMLLYGSIAFWVAFGAPWVFVKIGLADIQEDVISA